MTKTNAILKIFDSLGGAPTLEPTVGHLLYYSGVLARITSVGIISSTETSITYRELSGRTRTALLDSTIPSTLILLGPDLVPENLNLTTLSSTKLTELSVVELVTILNNINNGKATLTH